jgi:uncharacterized SAM-binding protein YcdF (DUF218 family)
MFMLSKYIWVLVQPSTFLPLMIALCFLLWYLTRQALWIKSTIITMAIFLAICVLPIGPYLLQTLEDRYPPKPDLATIAGIIVLGGYVDVITSEKMGIPHMTAASDRHIAAVSLARKYPHTPILLTGGSNFINQSVTTSETFRARQLMYDAGIHDDRLILEDQSRNTYENAIFSAQKIHAAAFAMDLGHPKKPWVLVTSAFHMPRAVRVFEAAGWHVVPFPVDYRTKSFKWKQGVTTKLAQIDTFFRECVGLLAYYALGRTNGL